MRILFTFLLLSIGAAFGSIDSGGGRTFVGGNVNYSSIGSPFSTGQNSVGGNLNRSGSLEVILPEEKNGAMFVINCQGNSFTVKDEGGATIKILSVGEGAMFCCDGTFWKQFI